MTALHKVGLAGLWMTLDYFERAGIQLPGDWERCAHGVVLRWGEGGPGPFIKALIQESFRIDAHGLIWLTALGPPADHLAGAIMLHEAMLNTFLQHGPTTRGADPAGKPTGSVTNPTEEEPQPLPAFQRVFWYKHQKAADDLLGGEDCLLPRPVAGWLYPGGVVRHSAYERHSALVEPPERWLALLFAPVGAIFFRIQYRGEGVRPQFALVLPEIADLEAYAELRRFLMAQKTPLLTVSGTSEAGWRLLAQARLRGYLSAIDVSACRVMAFGNVPWSSQQKTRVEVFPIPHASRAALDVYQAAWGCLGPRWVQPHEPGATPYLYVSPALDRVARNLTAGQPWYAGCSQLMTVPSSRKALMVHDRGGLYAMIRETLAQHQPERIFVETCHEAWRRTLGRLSERAQRERLDFAALAAREQERLRSSLARCKNAETLRETVMDFWSRSGPLPTLQEHWAEMLPFFTPQRWHLARDLALLALASYKGDVQAQPRAGGDGAGENPQTATTDSGAEAAGSTH